MENNPKVLILDNEEMVLETIEMFFPSETITLFTASSLEQALSTIETEKPSAIVSNVTIKEASGKDLIDKIKEKDPEIEIVLMSDVDIFKDTLAKYGKEISDTVYKPIDMDILETIIERALDRYASKKELLKIQEETGALKDENNNLNTNMIELTSKVEEAEKDNQELKEQILDYEQKVFASSESEGKQSEALSNQLTSLQKHIENEKQVNNAKMHLVVSIINALRKAPELTTLEEIFSLFEKAIANGLKVNNVKIANIPQTNAKKYTELEDLLKNNKLFLQAGNTLEIPFKIGPLICSIQIVGTIDINNYSQLIYLVKDLLALLSFNNLTSDKYLKQLEKEKNNSRVVSSILANIQMYIKKSEAKEKIANTKDDLTQTANDILNLIFSAQGTLNQISGADPEKVQEINDSLNKIISDKAQSFDIISQKLAQVTELVNNIQIGLSGKRMQQISGDQYLFSKDRK